MRLLHVGDRRGGGSDGRHRATPKPERDWRMPWARRRSAAIFDALKQINTGNVSNLKVAWTYDTPAAVPPSPASGGAPENEDAPALRLDLRAANRNRRGAIAPDASAISVDTAGRRRGDVPGDDVQPRRCAGLRIPARRSGSRTSAIRRRRAGSHIGPAGAVFLRRSCLEQATDRRCWSR